MSAKISLLKTNIIKNKSTKLFFKTMSSKFFHHSKSPKMLSDFTATKSTKFSDNNITKPILSSYHQKSSCVENPLFIGLEDFHKKFILHKYDSLKVDHIQNFNNEKRKRIINLKKSNLTPSIFSSSSSESKSGKIPVINMKTIKTSVKNLDKEKTSSFISFFSRNEEKQERKNSNKILSFRNADNKKSKLFKNNQIKLELFYSDNKTKNQNTDSNKKINIFNTYNNGIIKKNTNNCFNTEFSLSNESNKTENNKINFNQKNTEDKIKIYYGRNNPKLADKYAYPYYYHSIRIETNQEFYYKTKINIFNNYRKYLNKNAYLEHEVKRNFETEKGIIQEKYLEKFDKLFSIYRKSLEEYLQFLHKKFREIQDEDQNYIQNIIRIEGEIEKLKLNINKGLSKIKEGFSIKYFLTQVKNHTLSEEKFSNEDLKEIRNERLKLNEGYYLNLRKTKQKTKTHRKESISNLYLNGNKKRASIDRLQTKKSFNRNSDKRLSEGPEIISKILSRKNTVLLKNTKMSKSLQITNTKEEFFENLNFISSKVYNLILENNNKYYEILNLKSELANGKKSYSEDIDHSNYFQNQISLGEKLLHDLKSKNHHLISNLKRLKEQQFQKDVKFLLILQNIHKIYDNIKKERIEIINITKEMVISYGERYYLKIIEETFNNFWFKVNDYKKNRINEYNICKAKFDKMKKKELFLNFQRLLAEEIHIKLDKVLQKAQKVVYKKYRKTNDYKRQNKKHKVKKEKVKKTDQELFAEYIDNDSSSY